jgi:hypothetical protein
MKIGGQQNIVERRLRQFVEKLKAVFDKNGIGPSRGRCSGLPCPIDRHRSKWSEGVRCRWPTPQTTEQSRNDDILLKRRQTAKCCTGFAPLKEHGIESGIRVEQAHGWVTIPEAETLQFVRPFHVRDAEFEDSA